MRVVKMDDMKDATEVEKMVDVMVVGKAAHLVEKRVKSSGIE